MKNKITFLSLLSLFNFNAPLNANSHDKIVNLKECYLPNPAYYKNHFFYQYDSGEINPQELRALSTLETREQIKKKLQKDPLYLKADRLIIVVTSALLSEVSSEDEAIQEWREIPHKLGRSIDEFTTIQRNILDISDEKIKNFFELALTCKQSFNNKLSETIKKRILVDHKYHDKHQCDQSATRSINALKNRNIKMWVEGDAIEHIKKAYAENPDCPILEQVKNHQIFNIGNFDNSKGAFIVHDIYDHFWFFMKLEDEGFFNNYSNLMLALGNPHTSDIFSREGELTATVASHFRWFHFAEDNYNPLFTLNDILTILEESQSKGLASDNQIRAYKLIKSMNQSSTMLKALPFILSDMSLQMLKYITINGYPKYLDALYQPQEYFDPFDPEHIAFVTEATDYLFKNYDQVVKVLLNMTMWIENYLVGVALGLEKDELAIDLDRAEKLNDPSFFSRLSSKKIQWMKDHIGFEVVRYPVGR